MANLTGGTISAGLSDYNFLSTASENISRDTLAHPYIALMRKHGCINDVSMSITKKKRGDTIIITNESRLSTNGADLSRSLYAQAKTPQGGERKLVLAEYRDMWTRRADDTMDLQRDSTGLLTSLGKNLPKSIGENFANLNVAGIFNQLAGNTATTIMLPDVSDVPFTANDGTLKNATMLTDALAPSANYFSYGSGATLANPSAITDVNAKLTLQDLENAHVNIKTTSAGISRFALMTGAFSTITFISMTHFYQLLNQARAAGADSTLSQIRYAMLESGKEYENISQSMIIPHLDTLLIPVKDQLMPRASHNGTPNNKSRCVIIVGANAIDYAVGAAYNDTLPSFKISVDENTMPADKNVYIYLDAIYAAQKVQLYGFGANSNIKYDNSTYVIYASTNN